MEVVVSATSLGATVTGVDLSVAVDDDEAAEIRALLDDRGVLAFPGQHLDDDGLKRVAAMWAEPQPHPVVEFLGGSDVIGVVFNDADHPPASGGDSAFHTDYSFCAEIPDVAVLRSVTAPPVGGATTWSDAVAACGSLDPELRDRLLTLRAHHDPGPRFLLEMEVRLGAELAARTDERFGSGSEHPIIATHPRTGSELLFVNAGYTRSIVGLSDAESTQLLDRLLGAFDDPDTTFEHRWSEGDVVIWDEHRTVHRGPDDFAPHARELHRCTAGRRAPQPIAG